MFPRLRGDGVWIPAFAGMTEGNAGMTEGNAGMTEGNTGMTEGNTGMTEGNVGMTERARFSQSPVIYMEFFCFFVAEHTLNIHNR